MTNRKTPRRPSTNVQRSPTQTYVIVPARHEPGRVIEGLVRLLQMSMEKEERPAPMPSQSEEDVAEDAAEPRREE
jgi:hypothetical protein